MWSGWAKAVRLVISSLTVSPALAVKAGSGDGPATPLMAQPLPFSSSVRRSRCWPLKTAEVRPPLRPPSSVSATLARARPSGRGRGDRVGGKCEIVGQGGGGAAALLRDEIADFHHILEQVERQADVALRRR